MLAQIATAALMMAYALIGFAVLHTLTLRCKSRAFWLGSAYAIVVVFGWPVLALVALGARRCRVRLSPALSARASRRPCPRREFNL